MIGFEEQRKMFGLIGKTLKKRVECLVVGGSAMLFYNFTKTATKDIDLVLFSEKCMENLAQALKGMGFEVLVPSRNEAGHARLRFGENVFDSFLDSVFQIRISENMLRRAREKVEFGNLIVTVASPEDIILSKSVTDRRGDREDAANIIKEVNIDWDAVVEECEWQARENPNVAFGIYLFDFLEDLVHEWKADIPREIIKKITKIYEKRLEGVSGK